jgi:thioredoxin 1
MDRRLFIKLTLVLTAVPLICYSETKRLMYAPGMVDARLSAGETVFLDFKASWCSTCRVQEKVLISLKSENADYEKNITFIDVDWDEFGNSDLVGRYNIPRRSTLLVLKQEEELGRIVAGTKRKQIKTLLDLALRASQK